MKAAIVRRGVISGVACALALSAFGCGGSAPEPSSAVSEPSQAPAPEVPPPKGALWRRDVDQTVDRGLGYFLQRLEVTPSFAPNGSFQGFKILELFDEGFWQGVDLRPGDVVTRVNGQSIEREGQAYEVFQSLKQAPALSVQFLRDGQSRTLDYRIVTPGEAASGAPAPSAPASSAPSSAPAPKAGPAPSGAPQSSNPPKKPAQAKLSFTRKGGPGERSISRAP
ncbi:MAG: hypothetical protein KF915_07750 [Polyangiaceae bacterium]|nr:hypothetical protein [Polyangiaceae bacterium]